MIKNVAQPGEALGRSVAGWPLRRKMALALAVPLLLATIFGVLRVQGDWAESSSASTSARQVTVLAPAVDYLTAAETAMVAAQSRNAASQGDLIDAVDDLANAAGELDASVDDADLTDTQRGHVDSLLELSQAMRGEGAARLGPDTWISQVRQLESGVSQLVSSINAALDTPEPRLEQLSQTLSGRLSLAMQQARVVGRQGGGASANQELFSELGVEAAAIDRMAGAIEGMDAQTAALRTANNQHAAQIRDGSATNLGGRDAYIPYDEITDELLTGVESSLSDAASAARNSALLNALFTGLMILAAVLLALFITKLLLDPITRVREGALSVARQKLPDAVARIRSGEQPQEIDPIDVHTNEEIGQVARAVDDLHSQAIHLASGEAQLRQTVNAMFVTLSRRSNSLVNQQLAQIERLEQNEEDPKRLESLFRLDHLASRMRRTADSLLILADAPNRSAGSFTLSVGEALQAATSGVQDYQRVRIESHLGTTISEDAAADVVHLLTELVDNALTFSPPSEPVRLNAALVDGGASITVVDAGLGVPAAELQQLNADLAHGAEATPETARRMGLFVVSRLSERHGINTTLTKNPEGGMTATVQLPARILPELPQTGAAAPAAAEPAVEAAPVEDKPAVKIEKSHKLTDKKADKKAEKKVEKKAAAQAAKAEEEAAAAAAAPLSSADLLREPEVTPDRPPLESLVARREPGANMPRTGADAFLPPETSTTTGPLFGKRSTPATPATPAASASDAAPAGEDGLGSKAVEGVLKRRDPIADLARGAEKVAPVVPITALAARQRQQSEGEPTEGEQPAAEAQGEAQPEAQPETESASEEPATTEAEAAVEDVEQTDDSLDADPFVDTNDPLGLDTPKAQPEPEVEAEPEPEPQVAAPAAGLDEGLPPAAAGSEGGAPDSPIFKSMRSGWLATPGEGEWHETEVDRGWERAEEVATETPAAESTSVGLPLRQPGERLVPGSVSPPTTSRARDPEAIRRRLQAHAAGVSRGRRAATNSTQPTEAGQP